MASRRNFVVIPTIALLVLLCALLIVPKSANANIAEARARTPKRIHLPFLGLGPRCTGCPPQFCDDDSAIIHGYCCGCARFYDNLPVKCASTLECPPNTYDLCEDYEYMMHCCCS